jgi:hypothetical protein
MSRTAESEQSEEAGQTTAEYAMILGGIVLAGSAAAKALGPLIAQLFQKVLIQF